MNRNTKIIIAVLVGLVLLCLCIGVGALLIFNFAGQAIESAVVTDANEVQQVSRSIADYDVPAGYEESALHILNYSIVSVQPQDGRDGVYFMMMQVPSGEDSNADNLTEQMQRTFEQQAGWIGLNLERTGQETVTIRGDEVVLNVMEGTSENGEQIRQLDGVFQGNNGPVLLRITSSEASWEEDLVSDFLASIR